MQAGLTERSRGLCLRTTMRFHAAFGAPSGTFASCRDLLIQKKWKKITSVIARWSERKSTMCERRRKRPVALSIHLETMLSGTESSASSSALLSLICLRAAVIEHATDQRVNADTRHTGTLGCNQRARVGI